MLVRVLAWLRRPKPEKPKRAKRVANKMRTVLNKSELK
jgi:hypothetical protein